MMIECALIVIVVLAFIAINIFHKGSPLWTKSYDAGDFAEKDNPTKGGE